VEYFFDSLLYVLYFLAQYSHHSQVIEALKRLQSDKDRDVIYFAGGEPPPRVSSSALHSSLVRISTQSQSRQETKKQTEKRVKRDIGFDVCL
jgi:hypothetical protein